MTFDEIALAIWGDELDVGYVNKNISYIRSGMRQVLEEDPSRIATLEKLLEFEGPTGPEGIRPLLCELVKARKKVGYKLNLPSTEVAGIGS